MKRFLEGSRGVAEAIRLCKPGVISAYPITPQTHIVEDLAQFVADGELKTEFVNVESEHSAASVVLGALATGVRAFTATSSQGLLLMGEVIYNIAGMRLPLVLTCANRAVSAPISIWNDHQDSLAMRDTGWIQLYAENNQEALDFHIQAYKLAENKEIMLPVMVCMDGYILTHGYEPVDIPEQKKVDQFLPPYNTSYKLDPSHPITMGHLAEPSCYMETRVDIQNALNRALEMIPQIAKEFGTVFERNSGGLVESYRLEDAQYVLVAKGSLAGTIKEVVDNLRKKGKKVGMLRIITYRPLPVEAIYQALKNIPNVGIVEKAISLGAFGPLFTEIKAIFQNKKGNPKISGFVAGLGGRDITRETVERIFSKIEKRQMDLEFIDVKQERLNEFVRF
ncbi:MAG: pyruvate ferredoxin oxidoreductase [Candidatus Omnitrophica bacterium]|nr:pyruvate ferredoxin oxidoreductase [Candidatus Omnitrophota bacterium]